jgi:ADP-heptose:LPS heptosyltransferase
VGTFWTPHVAGVSPRLGTARDIVNVRFLVRILALQLKRIGDVILTAPALGSLRERFADAHITLAVSEESAPLVPLIDAVNDHIVLRGRKTHARAWLALPLRGFDLCVDFTGNDRSAFATFFSRAAQRVTFAAAGKGRLRSFPYTQLVRSSARENHTIDHYAALARACGAETCPELILRLRGAAHVPAEKPFVIVHPGSARPEKFWLADRWAALIDHIQNVHRLECRITGGRSAAERAHIAMIEAAAQHPLTNTAGMLDLTEFAALVAQARACISCDTAAVHLAAAFQRPQLVLFGPTNPFHWRPLHNHALVLSAAHPESPLQTFDPRMRGGPMSAISTDAVIRATDALLTATASRPPCLPS